MVVIRQKCESESYRYISWGLRIHCQRRLQLAGLTVAVAVAVAAM